MNYYRRLVALRKSDEFKELFTYGRCVPAYEDTDGIMAYYREDENKRVLVVANFGSKEAQIRLDGSVKKVLLSNKMMLKRALFQWEHPSLSLKAVRFWWCL